MDKPVRIAGLLSVASGVTGIIVYSMFRDWISLEAVTMILIAIWPIVIAAWLGEYPSAMNLMIVEATRLAKDYWDKKINMADLLERGKYIIKNVVEILTEAHMKKEAKEEATAQPKTPIPIPQVKT